ncbi:hypothetical protein GCM10011297_09610 [Bacterioplanes sanyensis]|nr:hypothetical protein GCM10011297_09610 [Bacterioplanes sanyensis]
MLPQRSLTVGKFDNIDREVSAMFMDEVVLSGLLIVGLTCAFFGGVYWAVKKDISKHGTGE